ncbi:MAG: hypothetical protein HC936_04305 [Leptolyngbyaceae cyanobacterium SU_3_3]|nr:hypothetical protein [Leptolyngbyaceae cyanobacterium SU_3_3]NJR48972.1 hypothetical protein [Leptolyngbyaceae cyanobacterium CSU_1_3]
MPQSLILQLSTLTRFGSHDRSPQKLDISGVKPQVKENTEKSSAVGEMVQNSEVH